MTNIMKNLEKVSLALGLLALLVSWIFKDAWIGHARPLGFTSLYICPLLGLLGVFASIRNKNLVFGLLNLVLIGSFFLIMSLGYLVLG